MTNIDSRHLPGACTFLQCYGYTTTTCTYIDHAQLFITVCHMQYPLHQLRRLGTRNKCRRRYMQVQTHPLRMTKYILNGLVCAKFLQNPFYFLRMYNFFCIFAPDKDFCACHTGTLFHYPVC